MSYFDEKWKCIEEKEALVPEKKIEFLEEKVELLKDEIVNIIAYRRWEQLEREISKEKIDYNHYDNGSDEVFIFIILVMLAILVIGVICYRIGVL